MGSVRRLLRIGTFAATLLVGAANGDARAADLTVSAAASLKEALEEALLIYEAKASDRVTLNLGASGALAQQILHGAPVDLFVAAGEPPMDLLAKANRLVASTRQTLARNTLVLVAAHDRAAIKTIADLGGPVAARIAIGDPKTVPAGQYAEETLRKLGLFSGLEKKLVYAGNVRQVLTYVESGNVDAGFVYATDARASKNVRRVVDVDPSWHSPITYPLAMVATTKHPAEARRLAAFLVEGEGASVLAQHGFLVDAVVKK